MTVKIGVISLGCSKNRVDTEVMMGILKNRQYEFVQDIKDADIVLINTCAFINDAKEEAIDAILEAEQQKRFGKLRGIIVTGCLPQRYQDELKTLLPRVDSFLGVAAYKDIERAVEELMAGRRYDRFSDLKLTEDFSGRVLTTPRPTAYVKIAEGCDNCCSYCVIPKIRGRFQSRPLEAIIGEIRELAEDGYSEIILVAQDTTKYGKDLYGKESLARLLELSAAIKGVKWLRILYSYPESITDELLDVMVRHDNIVKYIDMPIQHMDNTVLKMMNRKNTYESTMETLARIRAASPAFVVRSTVIVGFPGEKRESASAMRKKLREARFHHLGVFAYSQEEGTPAADLPDQIEDSEKEFRRDAVLNMQSPISLELNHQRIGKSYEVLIEGFDEHSGHYYGRSYAEAPEVDGKIFVVSKDPLTTGKYYRVKITNAYHYDCIGELD